MHVHVHVIGGPKPLGRHDRGTAPDRRTRRRIVMGALSIWHWLIVLLVVVLIFGTKKLRNIGQDLGGAVQGLQGGHEDRRRRRDAAKEADAPSPQIGGTTIEGRGQEGEDVVERGRSARAPGRSFAPRAVATDAGRARNVRHRHSPRSSSSPSSRWSCSAPRSCRRPRARSATCSAACSATSNDVKADIKRELELDELRKLQRNVQSAATEIETSMTSRTQDVEANVRAVEARLMRDGRQRAGRNSRHRRGRVADAASAPPIASRRAPLARPERRARHRCRASTVADARVACPR